MTTHFKPLGLTALCVALLLACAADTHAQDKGTPEKAVSYTHLTLPTILRV